MSVAPDLRTRAGAADERIVGRHAAIVVQPDDLAVMVREILRRVRLEVPLGRNLPIAERQEQVAVLVERDLAAEVSAALRHRLEQLLDAGEPIVLEPAAHERGRRLLPVGARLRVGQVEQPVRGEVRMRHHLEKTTLARVEHLRHAVDGLRKELALPDDAQASGPLRDQHVAPGQKGDGPRLHQRLDDGDDAVVVMRGSEQRVAGYGDPGQHDSTDSHQARKRPEHARSPRPEVYGNPPGCANGKAQPGSVHQRPGVIGRQAPNVL